MTNNQIFITSINKAINRAKSTGEFNLTILNIVDIYLYYINYTNNLISIGIDLKKINKELKENLIKLKYKFPSIICNYKNVIPTTTNELNPIEETNIAPTVDNYTVNLLTNTSFTFDPETFLTNFQDANGDSYKYLIVYPQNLNNGELYYNNTLLTSPITINLKDYGFTEKIPLVYKRTTNNEIVEDIFNFRVSDDNFNFLYSTLKDLKINAEEIIDNTNQPISDLGDNTLYVENRAVTIITLDMVTTGLVAPYNDPEGDLIDAIKIIDISNKNQGTYFVNGVPIIEGQIITREEIVANLFIHEGPDQDTISSDTFQFQARDEGSKIWVD